MTFDDMLAQVIDLLKRQGRVSYSALKRRFDLDDDYLNDLKDEILFTFPQIVDEGGRGLVWVGEPGTPPASISTPSVSTHTVPQTQPLHVASPPTAPHTPDAERRQLTVMFCDLVDSTTLSSQLDPEEYRNVVREYQKVCSEVITRFDGHIAQLLGDGLLVYFGYPIAHEEDAQRAIHTGLGIVEAIKTLHIRLGQAQGITLAVRLGIHTGLVVVGEMGGIGRQEQLALGEVPNVASRLEGLAQPNTLAISEATYRLIQGYFECQDLGAQTLRGVPEPVHVYRVLQASGARGRLDVAVTRGLTPLVGRESEVTLLLERWEQAKSGHGQVVLLSGDAGIGKSRLVQMLKEYIANESHTRWECRSSSYFENTALFPVIDLFQRLLRFHVEDTPDEKLGKLEQMLSQYRLPVEETVPLFVPLLALPVPENRYPLLNLSPQRQRQKTLETIVAILLELAEHHPVLFILEDLHWTDPTTLELLNLVIEQTPTASLLTLLTCRPTFQPSWAHRSYLTEVSVTRLAQPQVARMVERVAGEKTLPTEVLQQIIEKTDGVPLFVEEMTKAILESGQLKVVDRHYELVGSLSTFAIPAMLQDSLMARLDRLVTAKGVAQIGATIGRQFAYGLLQAVSQLDATTLQRELGRLVEAEIVYRRGLPPQSTYVFKHALIQDTAYQSLLKSTRQRSHQRIAQVLEAQFAETAEAQPELLAHHYTEAGLTEKAVHYWYQAGQRAIEHSAYVEAISHLRTGLALLRTFPETLDRVQSEVDIYIALGISLATTKGYTASEVEQSYARARQLCQYLEDPQRLSSVLRGLWRYYLIRAEHQTAHELGEQLFTLAQQVQDATMLMAAHQVLGTTLFFMGAVAAAYTHFIQGITHYHAQQHHSSAFLQGVDDGVLCLSRAAWVLWYLGYPDQGLARSHEAVTLAPQTAHPYSRASALCWAAVFHQLRREGRATQESAEAAIKLAKEQGFPFWLALGLLLRGWVLTHQGQAKEGIDQMTQGCRTFRTTGAETFQSYALTLLAEAHGTIGEAEAGLRLITEAFTRADTSGEQWYESELYRLQGALLLQQSADNQAKAETCFHQAIAIAQNQQAKSLELRAATSLARLWQQQGKRQEAYNLCAPVYNWFTEGFDTMDLKEAKALLEELS